MSQSGRMQVYDVSGLEISNVQKKYMDIVIPGDKYSNRTVPVVGGPIEEEVMIERRFLDVARVIKKENDIIVYSQDELLLSEYGLRHLYVNQTIRPKSEIKPLTHFEIEALISKEMDPKFIEGLRRYSYGRDRYYYNYQEDPTYKNSIEEDLESSMGSR